MKNEKNEKDKKSKLSLDDFKVKSGGANPKDALDAITGGILGACHDGSGTGCITTYIGKGY